MAEPRTGTGAGYGPRDYDAILAELRRLAPEVLPEWTGHSDETDFGAAMLELFAHMGDVLSYYQDQVAAESFLGTARSRQSVIEHLRLIGYSLGTAAPAAATLSVTFPAEVAADAVRAITVDQGTAFTTASTATGPSIRFEYTGPTGQVLRADPDRPGEFLLTVEEGRLVEDDVLGTSDGTADQRFALGRAPLILRSRGAAGLVNADITLTTRYEERGVTHREVWTLRPTLAFSPPNPVPRRDVDGRVAQRDFTIEIDADDRATVVFGDGLFGAVPVAGDQVVATYRVGGGARGNVAAGQITSLVGASELSRSGARVTNRKPATGGSDREPTDRAVRHAPAVFRSLGRAVTAADYEALALVFPGVGKVRAQPGAWNTVTLYVALSDGGEMSDIARANLRAYFEDKRPISVTVEFRDVVALPVFVAAQVDVLPYYSRTEVGDAIRQAARAVLAFDNVDFDRPIYLSRFYEVIEAVDGVAGALVTVFSSDTGAGAPPIADQGKITPAGPQLLRAGYDDGILLDLRGGF